MSEVIKAPQSDYTGPVVVDPLTRIEGHLRIEVEVEKGKIKEARSCGTLFRGLELILKGRDPRDAQHFTQRTCGDLHLHARPGLHPCAGRRHQQAYSGQRHLSPQPGAGHAVSA